MRAVRITAENLVSSLVTLVLRVLAFAVTTGRCCELAGVDLRRLVTTMVMVIYLINFGRSGLNLYFKIIKRRQ